MGPQSQAFPHLLRFWVFSFDFSVILLTHLLTSPKIAQIHWKHHWTVYTFPFPFRKNIFRPPHSLHMKQAGNTSLHRSAFLVWLLKLRIFNSSQGNTLHCHEMACYLSSALIKKNNITKEINRNRKKKKTQTTRWDWFSTLVSI